MDDSDAPMIIATCPCCNECKPKWILCKGPYDIDGKSHRVCVQCDMFHYGCGYLPHKKKCMSQDLLCVCAPGLYKDKDGDIFVKPGYCHECYRKLVAIGTARANGVEHHDDWDRRKYHKKCWKLIQSSDED